MGTYIASSYSLKSPFGPWVNPKDAPTAVQEVLGTRTKDSIWGRGAAGVCHRSRVGEVARVATRSPSGL